MTKAYVIEKTLQVIVSEADLNPDENELTEDLALEIAKEIDNYEWQEIDIAVVGVRQLGDDDDRYR